MLLMLFTLSWKPFSLRNQAILSYDLKVSYSRKQQELLMAIRVSRSSRCFNPSFQVPSRFESQLTQTYLVAISLFSSIF